MDFLDSVRIDDGKILPKNDLSNKLLSLIAVEQPYFALSDLRKDGEYLLAGIPQEQLEHNEPQGICTAEVGRHMAILGSLAVADANLVKERHFYLATDATLERVTDRDVPDTVYTGQVKLEDINKRSASVSGKLYTQNGELLYRVTVKYTILHERIFSRMFAAERVSKLPVPTQNPYASKVKLYHLRRTEKICTATLGVVREKMCAGHFAEFPAMPIARLGFALSLLAGEHLYTLRNTKGKYYMYKVIIHADSFIFAGQKIDMYSKIGDNKDDSGLLIETFSKTKTCPNAVELSCWFK